MGVYSSLDVILADENVILANPDYGQDVVIGRLWNMDDFKHQYDEYNETYNKPNDLLFYYSCFTNVPFCDEVKQYLANINFLFEMANTLELNIMVAEECIFRSVTSTNAGITQHFLCQISDNLRIEDVSKFNKGRIDVDIFLITDDPFMIVQYVTRLAEYLHFLTSNYQLKCICRMNGRETPYVLCSVS